MFIAVDIGGTKTAVAAYGQIDPQSQLKLVNYPTPKTYTEGLSQLVTQIQLLTHSQPVQALGLSIASRLTPDGAISNSNNLLGYDQHRLDQDLHHQLNLKVLQENDAACAALAEIHFGHGQKQPYLLHLILGTGFGGALAFRRHHRVSVLALQPGSMIMQPGGMPHTKKQIKGLYESYLGGKQLEAQLDQPLAQVSDNHLVWQQVSQHLAQAAYNFCKLFSAETITVSGGLVQHRPFIIDQANQALSAYPAYYPHPHLHLTTFETNASLIGALTLCQE